MKFALRFCAFGLLLTGALEMNCPGATPDWPDLKFTLIAGGAALPTDIAARGMARDACLSPNKPGASW